MRNLQKTLAFFGILVTASFGQFVGCSNDAENCELNYETCTSSSGSSSGIVAPPPECADSPSQNAEVIRSDCAYFVGGSNANDSNAGGENDPFSTLGAAINAAKMKKARVYLCGNVAERVDIPAGVSLFGGFDCTADEWKYDATQPATISPAAPAADAAFQASVRITGSGKTSIEDVNINAANAEIAGGSSIAVIVDEATVHFIRANLTAGDGKDGTAGITPKDDVGPNDPKDGAIIGNSGMVACLGGTMGVEGAATKVNMLCSESAGGRGGNGLEATGDPGADGSPAHATNGKGGAGETGNTSCMGGTNGRNGVDGDPGASATDPGTIDPTGFVGTSGLTGGKGSVGQGGGGGGGAKGKTGYFGASGGSGGAGGCPGNGGSGGAAGGSSIGIIHIAGTLSFTSVKITAGAGGQGGAGGDGQGGGVGGDGGTRGLGNNCGMGMKTTDACAGGYGGNGGQGGQGGGGFGGHSIGIAHKKGSAAPSIMGIDIQTGSAGGGGLGADALGKGGDGVKGNTHELN